MLSPKTQYNLKNAQEYFEEHLCAGDYYSEGQRICGQWFGKGAEALGLQGDVGRDEFLALCENHHPQTGESLTQRRKKLRREVDENGAERNAANRRVFYDFTLSPPKSVSIAALAGSDERIIEAHSRAVSVAMGELEAFASTRVRRAGSLSDRETGNVVARPFTTTPHAPSIRICTATASFSTLLTMPVKADGKRSRITRCSGRKSMSRTSITTSWPAR